MPGWPAAPVEYPPHSWRGTSQFYHLQHIRSTLTIIQSQAKPTHSIGLHIPRKKIKQEQKLNPIEQKLNPQLRFYFECSISNLNIQKTGIFKELFLY